MLFFARLSKIDAAILLFNTFIIILIHIIILSTREANIFTLSRAYAIIERMINMAKKLYKSRTDRQLFGVCGGLAEYLGVDSTLVRVILVLFCLAGGSGLIPYLICALIIPYEP